MNYYRQGPNRPAGPGIPFGVPPLTPYIKYIMIACAAVWLLQLVFDGLTTALAVTPNDIVRGHIYQLVTGMFLHNRADPFHLFFNMVMLWMFGSELERFWGGRGFLTYYLICGVGGAVCATILGVITGTGQIATVGASGALFGIFVAYGIIFGERPILFMLMFPMKARTLAMIIVGLNFAYLLSSGVGSGVSHVSHLGGALTGYLYLRGPRSFGTLYRDLRWKMRRRKIKMVPPDDDHWVN